MSDGEFENYLTLLASLLRLDRAQQQAIAGELRTHLEDRLDDLTSRGVPRDEAVRQALAEFGDAAGLADQFVSLSRSRKRRWLMRMATFSAAAALLVAAGLITFWPGNNAGPGVAALVAQAPAEAPAEKPAKPAAREKTLSDKLNQRIDGEFVDTPLKDVLDFLAGTSGVQFYISQKRLEESGIAVDMPVSKSLKQVRLCTLLDLILDDVGLVYVEKDDLLVITTREDADVNTEVRVYDCRDLFAMPAPPLGKGELPADAEKPAAPPKPGEVSGFGGVAPAVCAAAPLSAHETRAYRLMNIITTAVDPSTWQEIGGFGTISEYNGLIVISQSARTHIKIEKVLDMLRQAAGLEKPKNGSVVR
jgi:hypothetical protein